MLLLALAPLLALLASAPAPTAAPTDAIPVSVALVVPAEPDTDLDDRAAAMLSTHVGMSDVTVDLIRLPHTVTADAAWHTHALELGRQRRSAAVLWLDIEPGVALELYLVMVTEAAPRADAGEPSEVYRRRLPIVDGGEAATLETAANIVASIGAALEAGRPVQGMEPVEVQRVEVDTAAEASEEAVTTASDTTAREEADPAGDVEAAPSASDAASRALPPSGRALWMVAGYQGQTLAPQKSFQSTGLVGIDWAPSPNSRLGVTYQIVPFLPVRHNAAAFQLRRHPIALRGGGRLKLGRVVALGLRGQVAIDPVRTANVRLINPRVNVVPRRQLWVGMGAMAGVTIALQPWLHLRTYVGAEVVRSRNWAVTAPATERAVTVFRAHPVRFILGTELQFGVVKRRE